MCPASWRLNIMRSGRARGHYFFHAQPHGVPRTGLFPAADVGVVALEDAEVAAAAVAAAPVAEAAPLEAAEAIAAAEEVAETSGPAAEEAASEEERTA